jgi:hypothetical protein
MHFLEGAQQLSNEEGDLVFADRIGLRQLVQQSGRSAEKREKSGHFLIFDTDERRVEPTQLLNVRLTG